MGKCVWKSERFIPIEFTINVVRSQFLVLYTFGFVDFSRFNLFRQINLEKWMDDKNVLNWPPFFHIVFRHQNVGREWNVPIPSENALADWITKEFCQFKSNTLSNRDCNCMRQCLFYGNARKINTNQLSWWWSPLISNENNKQDNYVVES